MRDEEKRRKKEAARRGRSELGENNRGKFSLGQRLRQLIEEEAARSLDAEGQSERRG